MQGTNSFSVPESLVGKLLVASTTVEDPILRRSVSLIVHQDTENIFAVLLNRPMAPPPGLANLLQTGLTGPEQPASRPHRSAPTGHPRLSQHDANDQHPEPHHPAQQAGSADSIADDRSPTAADKPNEAVPGESTDSPSEAVLAQQAAAEVSKTLGTIHFGGPLSGPLVAVHNSSEHAEAQAGQGVYVAAQRDLLEGLVKHRPGPFRLIVGHLGWSREQLQLERHAGYWHLIDATDEAVFTGDQELWPSLIRRATTASLAHWLGIPDVPHAAEVN